MKEKKISIISIIYDVEPYLSECLDSILAQTYQNLEIILVVGHGKDGCERICKEYAKHDSRIKLVFCEPAGAADARNRGLQEVTGDYLGFVDGDDYIEPDMYESMLGQMVEKSAQIAVCGRFYEYKNVTKSDVVRDVMLLSSEEALQMVLNGTGFFLHCWDKLYDRSVFTDMHFPEDHYVEDRIVVNRLLDRADRIVYDPTPKYHFRERADSLSKVAGMAKKNMIANKELEEYIEKNHETLHNQCESFMIYETITAIQNLLLSDAYEKQEMQEYRADLKEKKDALHTNSCIAFKIKMKFYLALYAPKLLLFVTRRNQKEQEVLERFVK